ncbi:MAG: hypothetical protein OXF29_03485, partial [Hyphomicrobiales bacterium]|nr:hypothetical protein [Hyphomicrobiales bacterium]
MTADLSPKMAKKVEKRLIHCINGYQRPLTAHQESRNLPAFPCLIPLDSQENRPFSGKNPTDSLKIRIISPLAYQDYSYPCHITPGKSLKFRQNRDVMAMSFADQPKGNSPRTSSLICGANFNGF